MAVVGLEIAVPQSAQGLNIVKPQKQPNDSKGIRRTQAEFPEASPGCLMPVVGKKSRWTQMAFCLGVRDVATDPDSRACLSDC